MMMLWLFASMLGWLLIIGSNGSGLPVHPFPRSASADNDVHLVWQTKQFEQHVDHFGFAQSKTFQQRYLINTKSYKKGGPIFFYTGSEGPIEEFANTTGFMWETAADFGALIVFAEHRYYGVSLPLGKDSKYYRYLSSAQALADFASLGKFLKKQYSAKKLISFGCGYGGVQSAWFRMKYPHVVDGTIASSAPIFQSDTDCGARAALLTKVFHDVSPVCSEGIRQAFQRLPAIIKKLGEASFASKMKLCDHSMGKYFLTWMEIVTHQMAQVNYPYPADIYESLPAWPVKATCKYFTDKKPTDDQLLASMQKFSQLYQNYKKKKQDVCINTTAYSDIYGFNKAIEAFFYQQCTELIWPWCSNRKTSFLPPTSWSLKAWKNSCVQKYHITPKKDWLGTEYGSRKTMTSFSGHSNIVFSNGKLDPWSVGGVLRSTNPSIVVINMDDAAHCLDLMHSNPADIPSVIAARKKYRSLITSWIK